MKRMRESSAKRGHPVERQVGQMTHISAHPWTSVTAFVLLKPPLFPHQICIMDLANLSLRPNSRGMGVFKECIRIDSNYYPETLEAMFMINAPW